MIVENLNSLYLEIFCGLKKRAKILWFLY
jgi:hypothetical protein